LADVVARLDEGTPHIVVADDAKLVGDARLLGITDRRRNAGIGNWDHYVGASRRLAGELCPHRLAHVVDVAAADEGIRTREIDVFEDAWPRRRGREWFVRMHAVFIEHHDFAVLDVADVFRPDDVERAGFGSEDGSSVQLADHQGTNAERITRADELLVGEAD